MHAIEPLYSCSGFGAGLLVGMTGVGGGSLMTPVLILLFGIHPATAVGSDLLYAAATKTAGTVAHGLIGSISWRIVGRLAAGSVPMTAATLFALSKLDLSGAAASQLITVVLGVALFVTAGALIFRRQLVDAFGERLGRLDPRRPPVLPFPPGGALGVRASLSSVRAGALAAGAARARA